MQILKKIVILKISVNMIILVMEMLIITVIKMTCRKNGKEKDLD